MKRAPHVVCFFIVPLFFFVFIVKSADQERLFDLPTERVLQERFRRIKGIELLIQISALSEQLASKKLSLRTISWEIECAVEGYLPCALEWRKNPKALKEELLKAVLQSYRGDEVCTQKG